VADESSVASEGTDKTVAQGQPSEPSDANRSISSAGAGTAAGDSFGLPPRSAQRLSSSESRVKRSRERRSAKKSTLEDGSIASDVSSQGDYDSTSRSITTPTSAMSTAQDMVDVPIDRVTALLEAIGSANEIDLINECICGSLQHNNSELAAKTLHKISEIISSADNSDPLLALLKIYLVSHAYAIVRFISTFPEEYNIQNQSHMILNHILEYPNGIKYLAKSRTFETVLFATAKIPQMEVNEVYVISGLTFCKKMLECHIKVRTRVGTIASYELVKQMLITYASNSTILKLICRLLKSSFDGCPNNLDNIGKVGICHEIVKCLNIQTEEESILQIIQLIISCSTNNENNLLIFGMNEHIVIYLKILDKFYDRDNIVKAFLIGFITMFSKNNQLKLNFIKTKFVKILGKLLMKRKESIMYCVLTIKAFADVKELNQEFIQLDIDKILRKLMTLKIPPKLIEAIESCLTLLIEENNNV
jgi:hypothetical protein